MLEIQQGQFFPYHPHSHHPHHPHHPSTHLQHLQHYTHPLQHHPHHHNDPNSPPERWETHLEPISPSEFAEDIKPFLPSPPTGSEPSVDIVEEPQQRGFRFRYRCEGPSHGGLQGENSMRGNKTYPTVKISNHSGPAVVMVTLVTDEKIPRTHAHELMGKHCQSGICVVEARESSGPDCIVTFPNLGILHVTKKKVEAILKDRIAESLRRDRHLMTSNYTTALPELTDDLREKAGKQAKEDAKKMVLNVVRLSFQVYLQDANGNFSRQMERVISKPIYDSKCPGVAGLNICRMDRNAGCSTGYEEVFLLCDKVQKDDILVRFYEKDEDDHVKWEAFGNFGPSDVHRQYAIVFKTPPYRDLAITAPVQVMVQLRRISDHETSEPKPFTYFPQQIDKDEVGKKRKKTLPFDTRRYRDNHFQNGQHGSGGSGVSFCSGGLGGSAGSIPIPNLNNNTSTTNSGGRVQNYPFVHGDMVACASGPRMEMQPADPQMAAPASGLTMNACMPQLSQHMPMSLGNDQMFPKPQLANTQMDLLANQSQTMKPIEIAPDTTEATTFAELKSFLETCGAEVLLTPTTPLNVTTMNEPLLGHQQQQIYRQSQMQQQQQQQQQQQKQFMQQQQQQQQLQQAFPQMAQMAPMTQQTMQTAAMQQNFSTNLGQIPPPPQYSQGPQQPPAYSPAQGQYSPASQAAYSPASQQTYSPASQQTYSPVPPQAFSPGAQQAVSPGAQQAYSPGSAHSFSPGAQQQQQQQQFPPLTQPPQYSPNSQHQYPSPPHQHSPPTSGPYLFTGHDLVMDGGGDVETDSPSNNTGGDDTDDVEDLMCDSAAFVDDDLQEDAVPMSPREAKAFSERFHKEHESTRNEDELLINDLEKLSLGKTEKSVNSGHEEHPAFTKEKKESSPKHGKENTESDELAVTIPSNDPKQSLLDLQLATNVAKRSLVALHNFTKTRNPAYLVLCQRHLMSVQDDLGDTALHMAIIHRQTDVAYQLLQAMASLGPSACDIVNTCNILRQTPLQLAVMTAQAHLIRPLLAQKADCHLVDKDGNTPLHLAARLGFPECLVELLSCNLNTNQRQLDALNFDGFSALHLAIHLGHLEAMKVLLERGADINQRDGRSGRTALHHAVEANNHTMAGYILLKPDVDVNASAYDRNTALHMAVGRRLYDMAKLLIGYEANPEAESSEFISSEYEDDIVEDSDDLTEDGEDESEDSEERGYVRPIDMAQGDEKMLRILNHDDLDSGFEDGTKLKSTDSDEGDVSRLDPATLEALAEKLDTVTSQAGWRDLAKALGLMSAMDRFRDEPSPTRHILDTYKSEKGTLRELRKVFNDMERYDAAALVDKFLTTQHETELRPEIQDLNKLHQAGSDVDQGYTSSSLGSS